MREIDTDALRAVLPSLGIGNPGTATRPATFDDENVQQVLDVSGLIRRGRAPVGTVGIFAFQIQLEHAGGGVDNQAFQLNPYTLAQTGGGTTGGLWPNPVPDNMDVWVMSVGGRLTAGASADFDSAVFDMQLEPQLNAFVSNVAITAQAIPTVAAWDSIAAVVSGNRLARVGTGEIDARIGIRVPRDAALRWRSRAGTTGAVNILFTTLVGLFPAGLGQDIAY